MQLIEFGQKLNEPVVVCLGYFGCMHKGHVSLLDMAKRRAVKHGAKIALFTFSNNHLRVLGKDVKVLYTFEERLSLYESLGVDYVLKTEFTDEFRKISGTQFIQLLTSYNLRGVVCGFDYAFGSDRLTSGELSRQLSDKCSVDVVDAVCWDGNKVSTTLIRSLLSDNQLTTANNLLSEPFFLFGSVVDGRKVGTKIGFPTANLQIDSDKLLVEGVYGGTVTLDGKSYKCIVNIGSKPTFDVDSATVEAHIIDFEGNLYGQVLKVSLTRFLRKISKFSSPLELTQQLRIDRENVLND
ncbi:MAG: riboflavin biosynthesis protein RibF [Clostridiales bacterium]|nr:riboflavin biosynthesis protein RibF [Clostridiales bacterium]